MRRRASRPEAAEFASKRIESTIHAASNIRHIELRHESEVMMGLVERPTGNRLLTATMRNVTPVAVEDFALTPSVSLKMLMRKSISVSII